MDALTIFRLIVFFAPAYFANMAPAALSWRIKSRPVPLDFGASFNGKRIFGDHKTWRGFFIGVLTGSLTGLALYVWAPDSWLLAPRDDLPVLGILLSFGALFGDAIKSFFKRRVGIRPGERWVPFDQLDFVIGGLAFGYLVYFPGLLESVFLAVVTFILYVLINEVGWRLGVRESRW